MRHVPYENVLTPHFDVTWSVHGKERRVNERNVISDWSVTF